MTLEKPEIPPRIVVDAHQKIALQTLYSGVDYLRHPLTLPPGRSGAGLPDALLGRVAVVLAAIVTLARLKKYEASPAMHYDTPKQAHQVALRQWDVYQGLADKTDQIWLVQTAADLNQVLSTWQPDVPLNQRRQGFVLSLSGADPIFEPRQFEDWYARGVRCVGLAYTPTRYSGDCDARGDGLSQEGRELLDVLADYRIIVDLQRLSAKAAYEILDRYDGPLLVSHARLENRAQHSDAISRHMIQRLAERDGVAALRLIHLSDAVCSGNRRPPLRVIAEMVDRVCQWTGSSAHVAIGSDLASPSSLEDAPFDVDTTGDLWKLHQLLEGYGFSVEDVTAIMAGNLLRLLRRALP